MISLLDFRALTLPEKLDFFDGSWSSVFITLDSLELNQFLKAIICDTSENAYIRRKSLVCYVDATLLKKIKIRQALALLIDDWELDQEVFLELQRIKSLYLFYDHDSESVGQILIDYSKNIEAEIVAEAYYSLGLISFQKMLITGDMDEVRSHLNQSKEAFKISITGIENRVDGQIFLHTIEVIDELFQGQTDAAKRSLKLVSDLIFQYIAFTFKEIAPVYIGLYRSLNQLMKLLSEQPTGWLDFRSDLDRLYYCYSSIQNIRIEKELYDGSLAHAFGTMVINEFVEPFLSINFQSEKVRLNILLAEAKNNIEKSNFLQYLLGLLNNNEVKTKALSSTIEQRLKNIFPSRPSKSVDNAVSKIPDPADVQQLLGAYEELSVPSISNFTDKLIYACIMLQGNRLYWGNFSEDDRNTFISSMLESGGYIVKDQTRWSVSYAGKSAGEIDILIKDKHGLPFTVIEALNLDSLKTEYLILHLDKLFTYDANGFSANFILVYSNAKKFKLFWENYLKFVSSHQYQFPVKSIVEEPLYISDIRIAKAIHLRNGKETILLHIMIDLNK